MSRIDPAGLKPWIGEPPRTDVPDVPGYVLIAHERFDILRGSLVGTALMPFWAIALSVAIELLGGQADYTPRFTLFNIVFGALLITVLLPLVHEALHGLAAMLCGARPSYGIGAGFAYTTFREPVGQRAYLAIGLTPLVIITLGCVVWAARWDAGANWLLFFAAVNAGGSIGDLWMAWRIVQQPRSAIFFDLADGFAVLAPGE